MSLDVARPLLFLRAFARVATNHEDVAVAKYNRWTSLARTMGEFVSLLALVYLAEHQGSQRPYHILLGIFFAFFLPTVVLNDVALRGARTVLVGPNAAKSVGAHLLVGSVGILMCYAVYEAFIKLADDHRLHGLRRGVQE